MGYCITITNSTARIPAVNLERAYQAMCALNVTHDHLKRGGSWGPNGQNAKWFSWMDANYPETCADAEAVLNQLGFDTRYDTNGDLLIEDYDGKMGQEDLFLEAIENMATGYISWVGESGDTWTTYLKGDVVVEMQQPNLMITHG